MKERHCWILPRVCKQLLVTSLFNIILRMVDMRDWQSIAEEIRDNFNDYDGFIVLHGTDTMAYTASALSFMCHNLTKPIILTGSLIPLSSSYNDGTDNLYGALMLAGHYRIPEVCIYFNRQLLRGNRTTKFDASGFNSFASPNYPLLAEVGIEFTPLWKNIRRPPFRSKGFYIRSDISNKVVTLKISPGMSNSIVRNILAPPLEGCVMETYGAGNAPTDTGFLAVLKEAIDRGVIIINVTQCSRGTVTPAYETGSALQGIGVILGGDMTTEAALTKLATLLGRNRSREVTIAKLKDDTRGEMTMNDLARMSSTDSQVVHTLVSLVKHQKLSSDAPTADLQEVVAPLLLCQMARAGNEAQISELLSIGADASQGDYDGRTPLHLACAEGHVGAIKILIAAGAHTNAIDRWGVTPLDEAIASEGLKDGVRDEIIKLLTDHGAVSSDEVRRSLGNNHNIIKITHSGALYQ